MTNANIISNNTAAMYYEEINGAIIERDYRSMTVAELIEILRTYPADATVIGYTDGDIEDPRCGLRIDTEDNMTILSIDER